MTTPIPNIRPALLADAPIIARFNADLALESESKLLDMATLLPGVEAALRKPELCRYYLAEIAGRIVGQTMLTYEWSDWRNGVFWWIQSVYVHPDHRRAGVFRSLFRHIVEEAGRQGDVCGLRLYVDLNNTAAQRTYQNMGLKPPGYEVYELDWSDKVTDVEESRHPDKSSL